MVVAGTLDWPSLVRIGSHADVLGDVARPDVELAVWHRGADPAWAGWLEGLPVDDLPACRMDVAPDDAARSLHTSFDACGTPRTPSREALVTDIAGLVYRFASLAGISTLRLRLEIITDNACRRWHRDCVPLRLICSYRGPGTQWLSPGQVAAALDQPDEDAPDARSLQTGDVALFKGCGWPAQPNDGGIVHRSPRIAGSELTRLVLVLDSAWK